MSGNALTSLLKRSWAAMDDPSRQALKRAVIYQLIFGLVSFVLYVVAVPWLEHADISLLVTALVALLECCAVGLVLAVRAYRPVRDCYLARERAKRPDDDGIGWRGADALILYWGILAVGTLPWDVAMIVYEVVTGASLGDVAVSVASFVFFAAMAVMACRRYALGEWRA